MKIIQTFWSAGKSPLNHTYGWPHAEYNLMSWTLSCCSLREHYDDVELYTDQRGYDVLIGMLRLPYTKVHVVYNDNLCLPHHWAYAKIMTYSMQDTPFLHVDGDMYFPKSISEEVLSAPLITQNREIGTGYYRNMLGRVLGHPEICLPDCIRVSLRESEIASYNMGIFGGYDLPFIKFFCQQALNFIKDNCMNDSTKAYAWEECNILFEQVLFAVLSDMSGKNVATIGRPMRDEGYTSREFCNLTDYDNKSFFHILGGHKGSKAVCYALERVLLTRYREYFLRIAELYPENHPFLFPSQNMQNSTLEGIKNNFVRFLTEKSQVFKLYDREKVLEQEVNNASFYSFVNQERISQQGYFIHVNPLSFVYDFNQREMEMEMLDISLWFTRQYKHNQSPCSVAVLPGIDKHRIKVIPISTLGRNVIALLREKGTCTYGEVRWCLWNCFSARLRKHPKTLKNYVLAEIVYLAYNGVITIQKLNK